jgi:hypothetical protein
MYVSKSSLENVNNGHNLKAQWKNGGEQQLVSFMVFK